MKEHSDKANHERADAESGHRFSRRRFLQVSVTGAAIAGATGLSACMSAPPAPTTRVAGTTPKAVAAYQDFPNQDRRCAGCTHFLQPNACEIVAGEISPNGWCRFHEPVPV